MWGGKNLYIMTEEEWALVQVLENPVLFREFINEGREEWKPMEIYERAWTSSTANYLAMCCGRGVHKTTAMIEMLYYWAINGMYLAGDPGLIVFVPNKAQKDSIFPKVRSACTQHWLIKRITNQNEINVSEGRIMFLNGFTFIMRIAGSSGTEANVISLHGARIWVDEAQDFPWKAWMSLNNVLKKDIPWHMLWVSGVPNGGRRENVLYECDQLDDAYISFNISKAHMSTWTPEIEYSERKKYHALQEDTEDYKHYVLGQHGSPSFSVFDRARFEKDDYEVEKVFITQGMFESARRIDTDGVMRYHVEDVIQCPQVPSKVGFVTKVGLGYDPGFTEPAAFVILYQDVMTGKWKNLIRFILQKVEYPLQRETLAWLDRVYKFDFIGMDMGGVGKVQYQDLAGELSDYLDYKYTQRILPIEFGSYMTVAYDEDGVEKKDQVKRVAVETTSRWIHEGMFVFSQQDDDLMSELERTKYTRTLTGEPIYKTEDDHQFAALMCAIMAYEHNFGTPVTFTRREPNVKLLSAKWLDTRVGV